MKKIMTFVILFIIMIAAISHQKYITFDNEIKNNLPIVPSENPPIDIKSFEDIFIEKLSLREKIGQLAIVGFLPDLSIEEIHEFLSTYKIGGFILFKRNFNNFNELYELNRNLKKMNKDNPLPLFISIDEEGTTVSRLPKEGVKIPDATVFGKINNVELTEKSGVIIGKQLYAAGVNMNFAPVLDILSKKDNELFLLRSYGKDASTVSKHSAAFAKGLLSQKIIPVAKHFPGHGDTSNDSHNTLPLLNIDFKTLEDRELVPYRNIIESGVDAIMIGHLAFPLIDETEVPATKSKIIINDILRNKLNYKGIALTDDIEMNGFIGDNQNIEDSVIEAFNSGIDIFIIGHSKVTQRTVLKALYNGVLDKKISHNRLNESLKRIIRIKQKYNISDEMNMDYDDAYNLFTDEGNKLFLKEVRDYLNK